MEKIYIEAVEAGKQEKPDWADLDSVKKELAKLNIKNNAQFLFKYKYPSDEMVKMNEGFKRALKNAGFEFF
jgi:hypothetical protein